jgi:hypothetical protein
MATSRRWLVPVGALLAVLVAIVLWLTGPLRAPAMPVSEVGRAPGDEFTASESRESVETPSARAVASAEVEPAGDGPERSATSASAVVAIETWTLWGHVLRATDGTPAEGLVVVLGEGVDGASDARGRFEIELDAALFPRGSRRVLNVLHGSGARLASEERTLEPGLQLLVEDDVVELRGRVVDAGGNGFAVDAISIARVDYDGVAQYSGMTRTVDADGRFVVSVAAHATGPGPHLVRVAYRGTNFPTSVPGTVLASREGATIVLDLCPLRFEVHAADGGTLVEPELRLVGWRRGAESAEMLAFPELDERGAAEVFVERELTSVEIAVGAQGCAPWIEERATPECASTWRIELARFGPQDVLAGVVLDAAGRPVEGAVASCSPQARDRQWVSVPALRVVRTDAEGRFSLPFARGSEAVLQANHRDHGSTGDVLVLGGRKDVVLRFAASARVDVHVTAPDGASLGAEPTRFLLALADGTRHFDWGAYGRTWFEQVPAGSHRVLCLSAEGDLWGLFELEVFDEQPLAWTRELAPARWIEGVLVGGSGTPIAGVDVRCLDAPLEPGDQWNQFRARTDVDGGFRVLLGADSGGEIAFSRGGLELGRARFAAGDAGNVQLDTLD